MPAVTERPLANKPSPLLLGSVLTLILVLWCFNYVAGKIALRQLDPLSLASIRIEVAAALSLAILYAKRGKVRLPWRDAWMFAYLGLFGVVLNQGCFTVGLNYTTSERSVLVVAVTPIVVLVLARCAGLEAITRVKVLGMGIASIGVMLLESERGSIGHTPLAVGDVITSLGVIGFSVFSVLTKRLANADGTHTKNYDSLSFNTFTLVAAAVELLPLAIRQSSHLSWQKVGWQGWGGLLYMSIGSSVVAYTLFYWIMQYMDASRVAAIDYVQPFVVIALSMAFLGEHPTGHILSGGALVLAGVFLVERVGAHRQGLAGEKGSAATET